MAIRREAFEPLAYTGIGAIDFHMAMWLIRRGYRVIYWPRAHSYERISFSAKEEKERRTRMVAGRYQAISKAFKILPFNRPLVVWQIVSHKFLRPLIPFAMFGALLTNILAILWPVQTGGNSLWRLDSPVNWVLLGMQGVFYGMGLFGNRIEFLGKIGKLLYLPTFLVNSNFAALAGLYRFLLGHQTALWKKASRREAPK
jgi:cellulose synthase/poly-beta-1,6-N-acetylglucosamine synthase-like glycosyltransferase